MSLKIRKLSRDEIVARGDEVDKALILFNVRMTRATRDAIKLAAAAERVPISMARWILNAIEEKLKR
jgi:predicted HicB family RNase H-like nuclease